MNCITETLQPCSSTVKAKFNRAWMSACGEIYQSLIASTSASSHNYSCASETVPCTTAMEDKLYKISCHLIRITLAK